MANPRIMSDPNIKRAYDQIKGKEITSVWFDELPVKPVNWSKISEKSIKEFESARFENAKKKMWGHDHIEYQSSGDPWNVDYFKKQVSQALTNSTTLSKREFAQPDEMSGDQMFHMSLDIKDLTDSVANIQKQVRGKDKLRQEEIQAIVDEAEKRIMQKLTESLAGIKAAILQHDQAVGRQMNEMAQRIELLNVEYGKF